MDGGAGENAKVIRPLTEKEKDFRDRYYLGSFFCRPTWNYSEIYSRQYPKVLLSNKKYFLYLYRPQGHYILMKVFRFYP